MKTLKVNDKVRVISGDNKGTEATIVKIDRANHKAMLEGVEVRERHMKKTQFNPAGGKKTIHVGIDLSNLKLIESAKVEKKSDSKKDAKDAKNAKTKKDVKGDKNAKKGAK